MSSRLAVLAATPGILTTLLETIDDEKDGLVRRARLRRPSVASLVASGSYGVSPRRSVRRSGWLTSAGCWERRPSR